MTTNASGFTAVFTDYDHGESPYDGPAVKVSLVSDVLFIYVGTLKEGRHADTFEWNDGQSVGVDAEALYAVLGTLLRREDRDAGARLRDGTLPADHPARTTVPVMGAVDGVRRRA